MKLSKPLSALILIASALFLSAGNSVVGSPLPSPVPPRAEINKGLPEQKAAPSQRGETETPVRLAPINPTPAGVVSSSASDQQEQKSKRERLLPSLTDWILAGVTSVYAVIAFFTLLAINRQAKLAETAAIAAQQSAEAAQQQTGTLTATLIATQQAADAATKSADTGERARVGAERPHIIVQDFKMEGFKERIEGEKKSLAALPEHQQLTMPRTLRLTFKIKNYGKSPAFLTQSLIRFAMVGQIPIPFNYGPLPQPSRGWILPPTEDRASERFLEGGQLTEQNRMLVVEGKRHLVVFGFVRYDGISSKEHFFGFACRYAVGVGSDPGGTFWPIGDENFWRYS
ncbi:hypothetical protein [Candidatus Binatus sp.]|jgi:hypothetical protein|uniref:hypothetical protein n=1 Tax=Candidatus Binatus sp. TaxID=2811406 RepID=UPI003D117304